MLRKMEADADDSPVAPVVLKHLGFLEINC